jgi:hypothetical protein
MNTHPPTADETNPIGAAFPVQLHDQFLEPRSIPANWDTSEMLSQPSGRGRSKAARPTGQGAQMGSSEPAVEPAETEQQLSLSERIHEAFPELNIYPAFWELS